MGTVKKKPKLIKHCGVICSDCLDPIFSWATHDFRTCTCGSTAVDGGMDYTRIAGGPFEFISATFTPDELKENWDKWNKGLPISMKDKVIKLMKKPK